MKDFENELFMHKALGDNIKLSSSICNATVNWTLLFLSNICSSYHCVVTSPSNIIPFLESFLALVCFCICSCISFHRYLSYITSKKLSLSSRWRRRRNYKEVVSRTHLVIRSR